MKHCVKQFVWGIAATLFCVSISARAIAVEVAAAQEHATQEAGHVEHQDASHAVVPDDSTWAGSMVIVIIGMFVAAAVIGPIVRANMPQDVPLAAHDEPPGSSHHHGVSGTLESDHAH